MSRGVASAVILRDSSDLSTADHFTLKQYRVFSLYVSIYT